MLRAPLCLLILAAGLRAVTIPTLAGVLSIAASSGQIIREGRQAFTHPIKLLKHHGAQIKDAAKGKPTPPPAPVPVPQAGAK